MSETAVECDAERVVESEPDPLLLRRFAASRDEAAFAELVRRHGRLVWGVCRRRLARREDAEDAFQATFLILAVKAGTIRSAEALSGWLHRTACRATVRVASTTPASPPGEVPSSGIDAFAELARYEAAVAVDEELVRLPRRYRDSLVLFHLEELDRKEVAGRLGVSEATVKALLARGRSLLRTRLARRGVALPAVLPFIADPVPAEAAGSACRLGLSVTRGGVSALDLVSVPGAGGGGAMVVWTIGKTIGAGIIGAACLTLFLAADDAGGRAAADAGEAQASVDTTFAVVATEAAVTQPPPKGQEFKSFPPGGLSMGPAKRTIEQLPIKFSTPAEEKIQAALDQETQLEFPQTPLRDCIQFLADVHDINIIFDEPALTDAGVNIDENVDIVLTGITLRSALGILFEPHDLTYVIEDEVMKITTVERGLRKVETVAYDITAVPGAAGDATFGEKIQELLAPQPGDKASSDPTIPKPRVVSFGDRLVVTGPRTYHERLDEVLSLLRAGR